MPATALTVDQGLVDAYLARVDRFVNNVVSFEETLAQMNRPEPEMEMPVFQDTYQEPEMAEPAQDVITADDINIDDLLKGVDLGGLTL